MEVNINWYGQSCFRIESKGTSLLIDPFSKEIGLRAPRLNDNLILITHQHYDHNNTEGMSAETFLINGPGEYEKAGVQVEGIISFHDDKQGVERGFNTIYVIKMEDMKICHLGDLGQHELSGEQVDAIGEIDILFVPVGGKYTLDGTQAARVAKQVEPKIIIPMHYKVDGLKIDIDGPQKFIKEIGLKPEEVDAFKIAKKNLPVEEIKLVTFKFN